MLQNLLPAEPRLRGVKNIDEANALLPTLIDEHNARFAVAPASSESAYMSLDEGIELDHVFTFLHVRRVDSGCSISYANKRYVSAQTLSSL